MKQKKLLYFSNISGVGNLTCNDCGYSSSLHVATHSRIPTDFFEGVETPSSTSARLGYQCRLCGKFDIIGRTYRKNKEKDKEIEDFLSNYRFPCKCGGTYKYEYHKYKWPLYEKDEIIKSTGFYCSQCGKNIVTFSIDEVSKKVTEIRKKYKDEPVKNICKCGGELKRSEPIFCPKCQSFNVKYKLIYIT